MLSAVFENVALKGHRVKVWLLVPLPFMRQWGIALVRNGDRGRYKEASDD